LLHASVWSCALAFADSKGCCTMCRAVRCHTLLQNAWAGSHAAAFAIMCCAVLCCAVLCLQVWRIPLTSTTGPTGPSNIMSCYAVLCCAVSAGVAHPPYQHVRPSRVQAQPRAVSGSRGLGQPAAEKWQDRGTWQDQSLQLPCCVCIMAAAGDAAAAMA
jgi:hypothetical protein